MEPPKEDPDLPPRSRFEEAWRCLACGEVFPRTISLGEGCPHCQAPPTEWVLIEED